MVRWPGKIQPGQVSNAIISQEDWLPTLMAAAGVPDVKEKLLAGYTVGGKTFKVHLDGYNMLPYLTGRATDSPRREFFYFGDDGGLVGLRYDRWKLVFQEQRAHSFDVWEEPLVTLRVPKLFDLRGDPFERADHDGIDYAHWRLDRVFLLVPAQAFVGQFLQTFREFPPRQAPGSFNLDKVMQSLQNPNQGNR